MRINKQSLHQNLLPACLFVIYYAVIAQVLYLLFSPRAMQQQFLEHFEGLFIILLFLGFLAAGFLFISILPLIDYAIVSLRKRKGYLMEGITTLFVLAMGFLMCFIPLLLLKYAYALSQKNPTVRVSDTILIALLVLLATLNHFKAASLLRSKRCAC